MTDADEARQARIDALMKKVEAGNLTPEEADELDGLVPDADE